MSDVSQALILLVTSLARHYDLGVRGSLTLIFIAAYFARHYHLGVRGSLILIFIAAYFTPFHFHR
jgi:hypothetical protein